MKNIKCTKDAEPTFLNDNSKNENEDSLSCISDLPLFYTTQKVRDSIQGAMEKSEKIMNEQLKQQQEKIK